jgi:protein-disulfide isomerase-like protein with CxxC motif
LAEARRVVEPGPEKAKLRETSMYSQLRSFLSEDTRKEIESDDITIQLTTGRGFANKPYYVNRVLDELHSLEKRWKLL